MKKSIKVVAMAASAIIIGGASFLGLSKAGEDNLTTYSKASELYAEVGNCYNGGIKGPIMIVPGTYNNGKTDKDTYMVCLSGTEFVDGQATGIMTDLKVGFESNNDYTKAVVTAITENVPSGSNIILSGHSLGGMIAQQVSGNSTVKKAYNILNTVTFGSPLVNPIGREGTVKRLGDKSDIVPYLSASGVLLPIRQIAGLNREDGKYSDPLSAHNESYSRDDVWGNYDVVGVKNGKATFTFSMEDRLYYEAPTFSLTDAISYEATGDALTALKGTDNILVSETTDYIAFEPQDTEATTGFVFYPGAMVAPEAYSVLMNMLAQKGYMCAIAKFPLNMAIIDINAADDIISAYPQITSWYIGGHSLGGAMASSYAATHSDKIDGIAFLASYAFSNLSKTDMKAVSLYGSNDKVLSQLMYKLYGGYMPENLTETVITGGNHGQFGNYGAQSGDGTATITDEEQKQITVDAIDQMIRE